MKNKNKGILPRKDSEVVPFIDNFSSKYDPLCTKSGVLPDTKQAAQDAMEKLKQTIVGIRELKAALSKANAQKEQQKIDCDAALAPVVAVIMAGPDGNTATKKDLMLTRTATSFDPATFKASLTATAVGDAIKIKMTKMGAEGNNLYVKGPDDAGFVFVGMKTRAVFMYRRAAGKTGIAEVIQFMCRAVAGDTEVGHPSDTVTVTFAG